MHHGETIDLCAPFGAFPGAPRRKNQLMSTADGINDSNDGYTINAGSIAKVSGTSGGGGAEPQQLDSIEFGGVGGNDDNHIADNVDGFFDDFLALVDDSGSGGEGMADLMDAAADGNGNGNGDIAEEDLHWLEDMDLAEFLPPPPAAPDAALAVAVTNSPLSSPAQEMASLPEPAQEMASLPEPAVVEDGAVAAPVVAAGAGGAMPVVQGSSPCMGGKGSLSPAGLQAAAGAAPAFAESAGAAAAAGGSGLNDGGAVTNSGGGGGDAGGVSRKEQLRRQKVARYLAKKKNRQWSKAKASSYQSRQRVANSRPRHKGRFLPLESDFVPIAELQRRQRALMKQMQDKAAAARATAEAPSLATADPGASAAAASGNASPLPHGFDNQVAI